MLVKDKDPEKNLPLIYQMISTAVRFEMVLARAAAHNFGLEVPCVCSSGLFLILNIKNRRRNVS